MLQSWAHVLSTSPHLSHSVHIFSPASLLKVNFVTTLRCTVSWLWYTVRPNIVDCLFYCFWNGKNIFPAAEMNLSWLRCLCFTCIYFEAFAYFPGCLVFCHFCLLASVFLHTLTSAVQIYGPKKNPRHSPSVTLTGFYDLKWPASFLLLIKNLLYAARMEYVTVLHWVQRLQRARQTKKTSLLFFIFYSNSSLFSTKPAPWASRLINFILGK